VAIISGTRTNLVARPTVEAAVVALLAAGADARARDSSGKTALDYVRLNPLLRGTRPTRTWKLRRG